MAVESPDYSYNVPAESVTEMKTIDAAEFKEHCLALLGKLNSDGLVITRHSNPVAGVLPYEASHADLIGNLQHKVKVKGNIFTTGSHWDANSQS